MQLCCSKMQLCCFDEHTGMGRCEGLPRPRTRGSHTDMSRAGMRVRRPPSEAVQLLM